VRDAVVAIGRYPHSAAWLDGASWSSLINPAFQNFPAISRAFAPMVQERAFDVAELALGTYLQAIAYGHDLTLLPIVMAARFQHAALICRKENCLRGPGDLAGKRVGVRAYSQTTGIWLREILDAEYGIKPADITWVTQEGAHVPDYADPDFVTRSSGDLTAMLLNGTLDAMIVGNDFKDHPELASVFADLPGAIARSYARRPFIPVNHVLVLRAPDMALAAELEILLGAPAKITSDGYQAPRTGWAAVQPSIDVLENTMRVQGLLP